MSESDLFAPVKAWLEERDFTVYSEVSLGYGRDRADVVATRGPLLAVVELKRSLSVDLIGQCIGWKGYAHLIYAAVPQPREAVSEHGRRILANYGIGLLVVNHWGVAEQHVQPHFTRRIRPLLRNNLCDEQRIGVPGGHAGGGYVTSYSRTMERIRAYLEGERRRWRRDPREGWRTVKDILEQVDTHYANPKSGVGNALVKWTPDWCEKRMQDRKWEFRSKSNE